MALHSGVTGLGRIGKGRKRKSGLVRCTAFVWSETQLKEIEEQGRTIEEEEEEDNSQQKQQEEQLQQQIQQQQQQQQDDDDEQDNQPHQPQGHHIHVMNGLLKMRL